MGTASASQVGVPTWQLDPAHSSVEFSVKHMMMTTVRGRFKEVKATLTGDELIAVADRADDHGLEDPDRTRVVLTTLPEALPVAETEQTALRPLA